MIPGQGKIKPMPVLPEPAAPTKSDATESTTAQRAALRRRVGRSGDIVTGPLGVQQRAPVRAKTLLGE